MLEINQNVTFSIKILHFGFKNVIVLHKNVTFEANSAILSQKKRLRQHGGTKTMVLVKKYAFSKNVKKIFIFMLA